MCNFMLVNVILFTCKFIFISYSVVPELFILFKSAQVETCFISFQTLLKLQFVFYARINHIYIVLGYNNNVYIFAVT